MRGSVVGATLRFRRRCRKKEGGVSLKPRFLTGTDKEQGYTLSGENPGHGFGLWGCQIYTLLDSSIVMSLCFALKNSVLKFLLTVLCDLRGMKRGERERERFGPFPAGIARGHLGS